MIDYIYFNKEIPAYVKSVSILSVKTLVFPGASLSGGSLLSSIKPGGYMQFKYWTACLFFLHLDGTIESREIQEFI